MVLTARQKLKLLRKGLRLTQQKLADRAGLERVEIVNLESGRNQATAVRILKGLARGLGLSLQETADFLDGFLPVEDALAKIQGRQRDDDPGVRRAAAAQLARADGVDDAAIQAVIEEPLTADRMTRSILWWAIRMKRRELDLAADAPPKTR